MTKNRFKLTGITGKLSIESSLLLERITAFRFFFKGCLCLALGEIAFNTTLLVGAGGEEEM